MPSFVEKAIKIEIAMSEGEFTEGGNTLVVEGLACAATITKPGLPEKNSANVTIHGLKYERMEQLTMLAFKPLESQYNTIKIFAGEKGAELAQIFFGEVTSAHADFNQVPNPAMIIEASSGAYPQQASAAPLTVQGEVKADHLFSQWAQECGYTYINEGVEASVRNAWFKNSPVTKMQKLAQDIDCELIIDDNEVITLPAGQARGGEGNAVLLTPATGLIGYPTFNQDGIVCKAIFNPAILSGGLIKIESIVPKATGEWQVTKITHDISAFSPDGGPWETRIEAAYYG